MPQQFANNARALLVSGISAGDTAITIEASKADLFPTANVGSGSIPSSNNWFKATLQNAAGEVEIVYVRSRTGGSGALTNVMRGQEGTTARAYLSGTVFGLRITAQDVLDSIGHVTDTSAAHAASAISFTPAGAVAATDVQGAIAELDSEKLAASAVSGFGATLIGAANDAAARSTIGGTTVGSALFIAANELAARDAMLVLPRLAASATITAAGTLDVTLSANREVTQYNVTGSATITGMTIAAGQLVQLTFTEFQNTLGAAFRADGAQTIVPRGSIVTIFASVANTPRIVKVDYAESNRILDSELSLSGVFSTTKSLPPAHRGFRLSFRQLSSSGANGFEFRARDNGTFVSSYFYGGTTNSGAPGSSFILGSPAAADVLNGYLECFPTGGGNWWVESYLQREGFSSSYVAGGRFNIGTSFDGLEIAARSGDTFDGSSVMTVTLL